MLLIVATVISFVAWVIEEEGGLPYEALTILAIVILNAVLGYMQENRAEQAVAALQAMAAPLRACCVMASSSRFPRAKWCPATSC